jgi:imidazolonepropionase
VTEHAISINDALQLLRPPAPGLPYLRLNRAGEMTTEPGAVAIQADRIAGFDADPDAPVQIDARGCAVIPGFVDCHTHLPFAGWRAAEYALKVAGASYEEISRSGGGIRSSARALAEASDDEVLAQAGGLAAEMLAHGTTTFECKSGYGLSAEGELRSLRLARSLGERVAQRTTSTALLAHAVPDGLTAAEWMAEVARIVPEAVRGNAVSALDIYVESVAFTNDDLATMGELATAHGLDLRAHVEQFAHHGSVPVALAAGARSVDHVNWIADDEIQPLADSECAAVLLPGAEFMGVERMAPAAALADAGAIGVLATDANPGTSPIVSLPLVIGLAVRRYGWSAPAALVAATHNAAWVLRLSETAGSLEPGKRADVVMLDGPLEHVPYRFGHNPVACVVVGGALTYVRPDFAARVTGAASPVA